MNRTSCPAAKIFTVFTKKKFKNKIKINLKKRKLWNFSALAPFPGLFMAIT